MDRKIIYLFLLSVIMGGVFSSCMKQEKFPDTPQVEYMSNTIIFGTGSFADSCILTISYHDGEGDIGLGEGDTLFPFQLGGPYYYNFVIEYFEKQNGVFKQRELAFPLSSRIPVLTPLDPGRAIKGTISDRIGLEHNPPHDTIRLKVFIYDHALHKSNVITTPEIILRRR